MGVTASSLIPLSSRSGSIPELPHLPKVPESFDNCDEEKVYLYVYDMTKGLSPAFSAMFSKFDFEALWHTSVVLFDREYSFGQLGIEVSEPGTPTKKIDLGYTYFSRRMLYESLVALKKDIFNAASYDIFFKNCNCFSDCVSQLLTGRGIPYEYRTFGQQMYDQCVHHYNIRSQKELFEYVNVSVMNS